LISGSGRSRRPPSGRLPRHWNQQVSNDTGLPHLVWRIHP
jgi:hypothetical protein